MRIAELLGLPLPGRDETVPVRGRARLVLDRGTFRLENLEARVKDGHVAGTLALAPGAAGAIGPAAPAAKLDGTLELDSADLARLLALALGPQAVESEAGWSDAAFGDALLAGLEGRIQIRAGRFALPTYTVSPARFALVLRPHETEIADFDGGLAAGRLTGALRVRDLGGARRIGLEAKLQGARLEELVWRSSGRPVATGSLDATAQLEGEGRALKALVANLSGGGTIRVEAGEIRGLNPQAFDFVLHAADSGLELTPDKVREAFAGHLAAGVLPFRRIEGAFAATAGVLRSRNVAVESEGVATLASAKLDLATLTLDSDWSFAVTRPLDPNVKAPPPQVGLSFAGPIAAPKRSLDVAGLQGFLTVRAFEKEVERIEAMQADILEKQRFGRELIRLGQERRRREREAEAARAAEERAKAEAAARAKREAEEEAELAGSKPAAGE
jgi:hypothetical protein